MNYAYNKHTGEKIYISHGMFCFRQMGCKNLGDALEKGWTFGSEDYEEPKPKSFWTINTTFDCAEPIVSVLKIDERYWNDEDAKSIGNYFESKEEAEKAVEKLKAWKRLKDKGFKFKGTTTSWYENPCIEYETNDYHNITDPEYKELQADLNLLFSGEDN